MITSKHTLKSKAPTWHKIENPDQEIRDLHTSTLYDHYIITIGGILYQTENENDEETEDISIFNIFTYEWQRAILTGAMPKYRIAHTACLFNQDKIIVYGGAINEKPSNEVLIITITQENDISLHCEEISCKAEDPYLCFHNAEVFGDKMYVFGGEDDQCEALNELWTFDLKEYKWTKCAQKGDIPSPRGGHRSLLINNKMHIFGGRNHKLVVSMNDLFSLDLDTLHWSEIKCTGTIPSPRHSMDLVEHEGFLYLFGGLTEHEESSNELFSLNLKGDKKWRIVQARNEYPSPRANHTMVRYENGIFILGGKNDEDLSDLFYLNLVSIYKEKKLRDHSLQMSRLYMDSMYSDVVFIVQGEKIYGHKILLGTRCEYFLKMFSSGMMESTQKEIEVIDCQAESFKALLRYIYCDEVDFTEGLALDLFVLCNKWLFKELEEECEDYLAESLTLENVFERAQLAEKLEARKLMSAIIQYIIENMSELEKREDLYKMPPVINVKVMLELKDRAKKA